MQPALYHAINLHFNTALQQHPFNGSLSRTIRVSQYQKGETNLDILKQETVSGSGISWTVCKSAPRPRQITMTVVLQAGCPSCCPTNNVKALKGYTSTLLYNFTNKSFYIQWCICIYTYLFFGKIFIFGQSEQQN